LEFERELNDVEESNSGVLRKVLRGNVHHEATDPLAAVFENKRLRWRFSQVFEE
jgi:hypothetical protein